MGRSYPRFLLSTSQHTKSKGTFIVHTLEPEFIAHVSFTEDRQIKEIAIVKTFHEEHKWHAFEVAHAEIPGWWRYAGIHESQDPRDQVISQLSRLPFFNDPIAHYTVEEVQAVIRILFPTKSTRLYKGRTSYGLKHDLESLSHMFNSGSKGITKYCSNDTLKQAFLNEGFTGKEDSYNSPNLHFNITEKHFNFLWKLRKNARQGIGFVNSESLSS